MDVRLDGKVAIVTGGGGGFGRHYCLGFAASGAEVGVFDVNADAAAAVAEEIRTKGGQAKAFQVDVTQWDDVQAGVQAVVDEFGGLDILMNIAGDQGRYAVQDMPEAEWDRVMDINLKGMFLCCKAAIPHLIARGQGRIINMASSRGIHGNPHAAHYAASKAGSIALTKSLAHELKAHRITVNCLGPGATDTPMWEKGRTPEEIVAARAGGNLGKPEDLVPVAVFLASEWGYQITGHMVIRDIFVPR